MVRPAASSATGKSAVDHSYPHQSHELPPLGLDRSLEDSWHHESNTAPFLKWKRGGTKNQNGHLGNTNYYLEWRYSEELQKSKGTCKGRPSGLSTLSHGVLIHWISIALSNLILNVSSKRPCSPWEAIAKSHKSSLPFTWLPLPLR